MVYERFFTLQPIIWDINIYKIYPLDILLIITFISFLIHYFLNKQKEKIKFTRLEISAFVFFGACIITLIYSLIKNPDQTLIFATLKNYSYLFILFLVILIIKTKEQFQRTINTFLVGGIILIGFIIYGLVSGNGLWSEFTPGTRFLAQTHAYYLMPPIFLGFTALLYGKEIYGRILTPIILLIQSTGVIAGLHRHIWLGFAAGLTSIFAFSDKTKRHKFLKNVLAIILIAIILSVFWLWINSLLNNPINLGSVPYFEKLGQRFQTLYQFRSNQIEEAAGWRLKAWQEGIVLYVKNPILGIGFGKMLNVDYQGYISTVEMRALHNEILALLIQGGIILLIPFIFINYYLIKYFQQLYKKVIAEQDSLIALFAFYLATCAGLIFSLYLVANMLGIFYWITLGLIVSLYKIYNIAEIKKN